MVKESLSITGWDIAVIIVYFILVIGFGAYASLSNRGSVGGYFLAGRQMNWVLVGASLFASNIGSGHFIGLAGTGASSGIGIAVFEFNAIFILMLLGWLFVPVYIASGVFTMPEYMRKRFGGARIQVYLSVIALMLYILTKISADLFAGAIFIKQALDWNIWVAILILLAISALFTISGGLTAVIWTDFIQTVIMLIGAFILMIIAFLKISYSEVVERFGQTIVDEAIRSNNTCGVPTTRFMNMMHPWDADEPLMPWTGVMTGVVISSVWYWCSDQVIVQRALAAKNLTHAKAACVLAGVMKLLPLWLIVFPGMIARILYTDIRSDITPKFPRTTDEVACVDPDKCEEICNQRSGCSNIAYPLLVIKLLGSGLRGMMLAVMMASLMSSLTSVFNSTSTIFTMDIWRRIHKNATEMELMIVGRVFVLCLVAISIAWIPIVQTFDELFHYIQSVTSFLAPPICAVYILAIFWERTNEQGAFWGLMSGLFVGLVRMVWQFSYGNPLCGEPNNTHPVIAKMHYLHFGVLLWAITMIVTIVVSLLTRPIDHIYLVRLTFWSRHEDGERVDIDEMEMVDVKQKKKDDEGQQVDMGHDNPAMVVSSDDVAVKTPESGKKGFFSAGVEGEHVPVWRRGIYWLCGVEKLRTAPQQAPPNQAEIDADSKRALHEESGPRMLVNASAILLCTVACFVWGYFA